MSFDASVKIASSGMSAQRKRLEVISANLANAKTTRTADGGPYRKKFVVFKGVGLERSDSGFDTFQEQFKRELLSVEVNRVVEDTNPPNRVFEPNHPDADAEGYVLYPNINPVDEMVNMLGAARSYESNLEVLKTVKQLSNAALELGKG
jgi:flagellar basal-body rod protein FlgC